MKVVIVSGKGGTGKTTFSAMIHAIEGGVIADCDVDAPNLHILLQPELLQKEDFVMSEKAFIIPEKCDKCGLCQDVCRFDAISDYKVDEIKCEGCAFCYHACPQKAIEMKKVKTGEIYVSKTRWGYICHAMLNPGEENSGKLVTEVRKRADEIAEREETDVIIDGAPGIGCPVIASLTNTDAALIITEPTLSGLGDLIRIVDLCRHFNVKPFAIINRFNLNEELSSKIEKWCEKNGVTFIGRIPFSESIIYQMSELQFPFKGEIAEKIKECWKIFKEKQ